MIPELGGRDVIRLIFHCSYTPPDMEIGAEDIRRWHVQGNGWRDIGYHHVICRDGALENGRPLDQDGAHTKGYNGRSIGVCLVGGKAADDDRPDCNFTAAQWRAAAELASWYARMIPGVDIAGHRDFAPGRACPTFDVRAWADETIKPRRIL